MVYDGGGVSLSSGRIFPDYLTSVRDGGFYGWPWSYYGQHVDQRVEPKRPDMVAKAIVPDCANAKSVMGVLLLCGAKGTYVTVRASGDDADECIRQIGELITNRFGEDR